MEEEEEGMENKQQRRRDGIELCLVEQAKKGDSRKVPGETGSWRRAERFRSVWAGGQLAANSARWPVEVSGAAEVAKLG